MADRADRLVLDASVAVKWHLLDEEYASESAAVLTAFAQGRLELLAPVHISYEVASAITVATLRQTPRLSPRQGRDAVEEFLNLDITRVDDAALILSAYSLVHTHGIALYDAVYLALAQQMDCPLITADSRLYRGIQYLPDVLWIGDYQQRPVS